MGFTVLLSTTGAKLWRVNRIMRGSQSYQRVALTAREVLKPLLVFFTCNFILIVVQITMFPDQYVRKPIDEDEPGTTYGECQSNSEAYVTPNTFVGLFNFGAFVFAVWQACRARNISDEFSESKRLGFGLFLWGQLLLIAVPILAILGGTASAASLYILIALLFGFCTSMIVALYIPIYMHVRKESRQQLSNSEGRSHVRVTGLESTETRAPFNHGDFESSTSDNQQPGSSSNSRQETTISSQHAGRIEELESYNKELEQLIDLYKQKHGELDEQSSV